MAIDYSSIKPPIGWGGSWLDSQLNQVLSGLVQDNLLGALNISVVTGAAQGNAISLTGAAADDRFIGALTFAGAGTDVTDVGVITPDQGTMGDGTITFSVNTSGSKVAVFWIDVSALQVTP